MRRLLLLSLVILALDAPLASAADCPPPPTAWQGSEGGVEIGIQGIVQKIIGFVVRGTAKTEITPIDIKDFKDPDRAVVNLYTLYMLCLALQADEEATAEQKVKMIQEVRNTVATSQITNAINSKEKRAPTQREQEEIDMNVMQLMAGSKTSDPVIANGANILWIDDTPRNNVNEIAALKALGHRVDIAISNVDAEEFLEIGEYNLIVSDIRRKDGSETGLAFLERLARTGTTLPPRIFYILDMQSYQTPSGDPVTNHPAELLTLIKEALVQK